MAFNIQKSLWTVLLTFVLATEIKADGKPLEVVFVNPATAEEVFWAKLIRFMRFAADDLNVSLSVVASEHNRFKTLEVVKEILKSDNKPDYLIFQMQAQVGNRILALAEEAKVGSLVINTDIPDEDRGEVGSPRGKYKYWLGHIYPNDHHAGYGLAANLVDAVRRDDGSDTPTQVSMIALAGTRDNQATFDRNQGLREFVDEHENGELTQIVHASWKKSRAEEITMSLMRRYPGTNVIWAASDHMALGAIAALERLKIVAGEDVHVGGIDWTDAGLAAVQEGKLTASMGGHFMEGAWAIVLLHDYFHGYDFAEVAGATIMTKMTLVTQENVGRYIDIGNAETRTLDFKTFSRKYHPSLDSYHFTLLPHLK